MIRKTTTTTVILAVWLVLCHHGQAQQSLQPVAAPQAACTDPGCTDCAGYGVGCTTGCECLACRPRSTWASFDYMMMWGKGRAVPALVTTSPPGTAQAVAGVIGQPDTSILFGDGNVGNRLASGARADFGMWFDSCRDLGLGAKVWGVQGNSTDFFGSSTGNPILARPFINAQTGLNDAILVAFPAIVTGDLSANTGSDLLAVEAYLRSSVWAGQGYSVDLMGGYHFTRLDDEVAVTALTTSIDPGGAVPVGTTIDFFDNFDARNEFHGGELGVIGELYYCNWTIKGLAKMSVGNMRQQIIIDGRTRVTTPAGASASSAGGLLAMPTNIGAYTRNRTAIVPEIGLTLAYEFDACLRATFGYSAIYWSNVAFAGDQIDPTVNISQAGGNPLIGPANPQFTFRETDYWVHGLTFGVEVLW